MEYVSNDWLALLSLATMLGLRHGLDADHVAAIDGLTRSNSQMQPALAPWCGTLFALGHSVVVIVIAVAVATVSGNWRVPSWAETFGAWSSIIFLAVLGFANLLAVLRADSNAVVRPVGFKDRFLSSLQRTSNPWLITLIGALFAFSFDSLGQAALFAVMGVQQGGWGYALILGVAFAIGMLVTDGVNGLWTSRLIRRADGAARIASRAMGFCVAGVSLLVAGLGAARYFSPTVDAWSDGKGIVFGVAIIAVIAVSFILALWLARSAPARSWSET